MPPSSVIEAWKPSMATRTRSGSPGPAIHGRAFAGARAYGSRARLLTQGGSANRSARKSTNARTRGGTRRRCGITA